MCTVSGKKNVCGNPAAILNLWGVLKDNVYNNKSRTEDGVTKARPFIV